MAANPSAEVTEVIVVEEREPTMMERLRPDTDLHREVLCRLNDRRRASETHRDQRLDDHRRVNEHLRLYHDLSQSQRNVDKSEDSTKREMPWGRSLVIPVSHAMIWTRVVEIVSMLSARDPLIHLQGRGGFQDVERARILEAVLRYDYELSGDMMVLYQAVFDAERYGVCWVYDTWEDEWGWVFRAPDVLGPVQALLPAFAQRAMSTPRREWAMKREYLRWLPIDPGMMLTDPRVPLGEHHRGEWCGHSGWPLWLDLHAASVEFGGPYFNTEAARKYATSVDEENRGQLDTGRLDSSGSDTGDTGAVLMHSKQVRIIPRLWKLSQETRPELWQFAWVTPARGSDGGVIVRCHPSVYDHQRFTYSNGQTNPDRYAAFTPGSGELNDGIQRFSNFLINSSIRSVMTTMFNRYLFDPLLVEQVDLDNPAPGRNIRITEEAHELIRMGHPLAGMLQQVSAVDVSGANVGMFNVLYNQGQRMLAANDTAQGMPLPDKRTLGEVQATMQASSKRLQMVAKLIDRQLIADLARKGMVTRQQLTSAAQWVRITGDMAKRLGVDQIRAMPQDLYCEADYIPHTPTQSPDPARIAQTWIDLLQTYARIPGLQAPMPDGRVMNPHALVEQIAQAMGVNYFDQLYIQASVQPDEVVQQQAQAGNIVPVGAA